MILAELIKGGITGILGGVSNLIGTFKADPLEVIKIQSELTKAGIEIETALIQAQSQINALEAVNPSRFISWWRPAAGWVCVAGLAYDVILRPIFESIMVIYRPEYHALALDSNVLMTLLFGMLGLGVYRSYEKVAGVAGNGR